MSHGIATGYAQVTSLIDEIDNALQGLQSAISLYYSDITTAANTSDAALMALLNAHKAKSLADGHAWVYDAFSYKDKGVGGKHTVAPRSLVITSGGNTYYLPLSLSSTPL
jgi:hypothetical protein